MKTTLLYGKENLTINLPEDALILEPKNLPGVADEMKALKRDCKIQLARLH